MQNILCHHRAIKIALIVPVHQWWGRIAHVFTRGIHTAKAYQKLTKQMYRKGSESFIFCNWKKKPKKLQFSKPCMFFWSSYFIVKIFFLFIRSFQVLTPNFFSWSAFFHLKAWFSLFSLACNYDVIKTTVPFWINLTYKRHCSILHSIYLQELHMQEMTCKYDKQMDLFLFSLIIWADCSFVRITVMHNELLNNSPVHPDVSGSWAKTF